MGLFNLFRKKYDERWDNIIHENRDDITMGIVIENFFKVDDISPDKYVQNFESVEEATMGGMLTLGIRAKNGTPSLEFAANPLNRGSIFPNWFYTTYPDVIVWLHRNSDNIKSITGAYDAENPTHHAEIFRKLIDAYKKQGNKLECSR